MRRKAADPLPLVTGGAPVQTAGVTASSQPADASRHRSVRDMAGEELRTYARKLGILERDVTGLTEERLRENCLARIYEAAE
jgi:hypothetical protein